MTDRMSAYPIDPIFLHRWSPRAFDGQPLPQADLETMLEAARWAPSAYNVQPWRLLYAIRDDANWMRFLDLLIPFNQGWAKDAGALVFIVSDTLNADKPNHSHSFDSGAAWAQLALQAHLMGYRTHGMTGIAFDRIPAALNIPDRFRVEAAVAIGRIGDPAALPEGLRARETPSDRKPLAEIAYPGDFRG